MLLRTALNFFWLCFFYSVFLYVFCVVRFLCDFFSPPNKAYISIYKYIYIYIKTGGADFLRRGGHHPVQRGGAAQIIYANQNQSPCMQGQFFRITWVVDCIYGWCDVDSKLQVYLVSLSKERGFTCFQRYQPYKD